jgi:hypothetical protein
MTLRAQAMQQPSLVSGPDGTVFLTGYDGTYQFDASGKQIASLVSPNQSRQPVGHLVGVWQGKALVVDGQELRQVPMPVATVLGQ